PLLARIAPEGLGVAAQPSPPPAAAQPARPRDAPTSQQTAPSKAESDSARLGPPALLASPPPEARGPSRRTVIAIVVSVAVAALVAGAVGLGVGLQPHQPETTLGDIRSTK